jgi:hemolysin activation/secretion protein
MNTKKRVLFLVCLICLASAVVVCFAAKAEPPAAQTQPAVTPLEEKPTEATVETKAPVAQPVAPPAVTTLAVKEVSISGNTLIPTEELLEGMPDVYNASKKPLEEAPPNAVFDLTVLKDIICNPGEVRDVSTQSIQGLTKYILSVYQKRNYAGIYVYVPAQAFAKGKLKGDVLSIRVLEAGISNVGVTYRDVNGVQVEKGRLRLNQFLKWSPVEAGQVANKKKLDDYINLLNLNPDLRVYATVSPGAEPNTLALKYDIYEANPWHYFIQLDNAGTGNLEWAPRIGVINTNLLGFDDKFIGVVQGSTKNCPIDNYAAYGSYDFPIGTPRLRLNLFASRSEFDVVSAVQGLDFLGAGYSYGGILRYNAFQTKGWFFDILGTLRKDKSHFRETRFGFGSSEVGIDLWGIGFDIHRTTDMSNTSIISNYLQRMCGSGQAAFDEIGRDAQSQFSIWTLSAAHQQFLDPYRVNRLLGSFTYIRPDERLAPVEMTSFGGLYTVRGYHESEIVADGGIIASVQYEYDIVKAIERSQAKEQKAPVKKPCLRKLAPCGFWDYGRAVNEKPIPAGEEHIQELCSLGVGLLTEIGDHFSSGIYYGWPLRSTDETESGNGRCSINLMMRW